jgi:hypothetical protein
VVTDQVLAVALVTLVVVVLAGVGVVLAVGHDRPGYADQGMGDRGGGLLLMVFAEPARQSAELAMSTQTGSDPYFVTITSPCVGMRRGL